MARFGKILVFLHVGLSLGLATWAVSVYTNRVDYKSKQGEVETRKAKYEQLAKDAVRPADGRWRAAERDLLTHEGWRPFEKAWFARELEFLRSQATEAKPARRLARGADGGLVFVQPPAGQQPLAGDLFRMEAVKDANDKEQKFASLTSYLRDLDAAVKQTEAESKRLEAAAKRELVATGKLNGDGNTRGLHKRLQDEFAKRDRVEKEYREVRPMWLNAKVELDDLQQLTKRLRERVDELRGADSPRKVGRGG